MPRWLRLSMYGVAGAIGVGGALLDFSKPVTMVAAFAVMGAIEAANYFAQRLKRHDA